MNDSLLRWDLVGGAAGDMLMASLLDAGASIEPIREAAKALGLDSVELTFEFQETTTVRIEASVNVHARTGVEMEALTAVSVAALTIYDMCKAVDRDMTIGPFVLLEKTGGKSGHFIRKED